MINYPAYAEHADTEEGRSTCGVLMDQSLIAVALIVKIDVSQSDLEAVYGSSRTQTYNASGSTCYPGYGSWSSSTTTTTTVTYAATELGFNCGPNYTNYDDVWTAVTETYNSNLSGSYVDSCCGGEPIPKPEVSWSSSDTYKTNTGLTPSGWPVDLNPAGFTKHTKRNIFLHSVRVDSGDGAGYVEGEWQFLGFETPVTWQDWMSTKQTVEGMINENRVVVRFLRDGRLYEAIMPFSSESTSSSSTSGEIPTCGAWDVACGWYPSSAVEVTP